LGSNRSVIILKLRKFLLSAFFVPLHIIVSAQEENGNANELFTPLKIAEFTYSNIFDYNLRSQSSQFGDYQSKVQRFEKIRARLILPAVLKEHFKLGVQLMYDRETFLFESEYGHNDYPLFEKLDSRRFHSTGFRIMGQNKLNNGSEITFVAGLKFNSDHIHWDFTEEANYSIDFMYRKKIARGRVIGGGLTMGYNIGQPYFYPVLIYEKDFSKKLKMNLTLPKLASLKYLFSNKANLTLLAVVKGSRYLLRHHNLGEEGDLVLDKSELRLTIAYEREVFNWIWIGIEGGFSNNLRYDVRHLENYDKAFDLVYNGGTFLKTGIFLVPPRKWFNK